MFQIVEVTLTMMANRDFEVGTVDVAGFVVEDANNSIELVDAVGAAIKNSRLKLCFQFAFGLQNNQSVVFQLFGSIV